MKIAILTGSSLRHKAFAHRFKFSKKISIEKVFYEKGDALLADVSKKENNQILITHLDGRNQTEQDYFNWFLEFSKKEEISEEYVERNYFNEEEFLEKILSLQVDLLVVYGTSIIKGKIIKIFKNKIINLHLGLSPYYRGAGTNYFPFVNNEPEYCGATFMFIDEGIDTGEIIHQIRPEIISTDSFHQLSNRFLIKTFDTYLKLIERFKDLNQVEKFIYKDNTNFKTYRRKDFTDSSLEKLYKNFRDDILNKYLINKLERDEAVPIIQNQILLL